MEPIVSISGGRIRGEQGADLCIFRGIPYAAPPTGERRWRAPRPVQPWAEVRDCTRFGRPAPQPLYPKSSPFFWNPGPTSEDCLYLNVWTGAGSPDERRPVMVWLHGGAYSRGTGARPVYDGTMLARLGVVLVTLNYRLGPFGFLAHPELSARDSRGVSGNYGILDQIAALQWIRDEIGHFGGDPKRVTLFGESAGAWSISALMASPPAAGLFHGVIAQSGALFHPMRHLRKDTPNRTSAHTQGLHFARQLKAAGAAQLCALPAEIVVPPPGQPGSDFLSYPVVDGQVLEEDIYTSFERGRIQRVPVLLGSNADEGTVFANQVPETEQGLNARIERDYGPLAGRYRETYPFDSDEEAHQAGIAMFGDIMFHWPMRAWARFACAWKIPVWRYLFEMEPPIFARDTYRAFHSAEISYIFGTLDETRWQRDQDLMLSRLMSLYWVQFAKTGNPNGGGNPHWPTYGLSEEAVIVFGERTEIRENILAEECDLADALQAWKRRRRGVV